MEVTLGNVTETMADMWIRQQQAVSSLSKRAGNWDVAANTPGSYLQQIVDGLNEQFNAQGMSYCFTSFEAGTIWSSVPLDDQGRPTKAGGSAIQISSQGFRIASGTKADGSYDWRTFGTGKGFTADVITAGTIKGGSNTWNLSTGDLAFRQGAIYSANMSSVWNLTNGQFVTTGMTANSITATGQFSCGSTYGIKLNSAGQMAGYYNSSQVGYIDYSGSFIDIPTGQTVHGMQLQAVHSIRISSPKIAAAATSNTSVTATYGATGSIWVVGFDSNPGSNWSVSNSRAYQLSFVNGICTSSNVN